MYKSYLLLDKKVIAEFQKDAKESKEYPCDYGRMRQLRIRLQDLCGITEIEAINVLTGNNVLDYLSKYNGYTTDRDMIEDKTILIEEFCKESGFEGDLGKMIERKEIKKYNIHVQNNTH